MKRFHVHLAVEDLASNIRFYSGLFGMRPSVEKADYAKWMLDDPRVNFAISARGHAPGVNHLGLQVETDDELAELNARFEAADIAALAQTGAACCYAKSDKYWVQDPQGLAWETFHTLGEVPVFGSEAEAGTASACCVPEVPQSREGSCGTGQKKSEAGSGCCG